MKLKYWLQQKLLQSITAFSIHFLYTCTSKYVCSINNGSKEQMIYIYVQDVLFKMLGLYLYTLIIGHKFCSMLSLHIFILRKELQKFM